MDIYSEISNRIIQELEKGIIPWMKPWMAAGRAISHTTGKSYSLLNQMLLGRDGEYLTFKQVQQEGGYVRKGEKAHTYAYFYATQNGYTLHKETENTDWLSDNSEKEGEEDTSWLDN